MCVRVSVCVCAHTCLRDIYCSTPALKLKNESDRECSGVNWFLTIHRQAEVWVCWALHRQHPVLAPLYRNRLSYVVIVIPLISFIFNVTMLFLIYYFQTMSRTSNYSLRTPPHMYTRQQALNVACYRGRTSVFVAAYQQTPSSEVPFIINLEQSRGLIVSLPINTERPTMNSGWMRTFISFRAEKWQVFSS